MAPWQPPAVAPACSRGWPALWAGSARG